MRYAGRDAAQSQVGEKERVVDDQQIRVLGDVARAIVKAVLEVAALALTARIDIGGDVAPARVLEVEFGGVARFGVGTPVPNLIEMAVRCPRGSGRRTRHPNPADRGSCYVPSSRRGEYPSPEARQAGSECRARSVGLEARACASR